MATLTYKEIEKRYQSGKRSFTFDQLKDYLNSISYEVNLTDETDWRTCSTPSKNKEVEIKKDGVIVGGSHNKSSLQSIIVWQKLR